MGDCGAGLCGCTCCSAGIGEQVEDLNVFLWRILYQFAEPVPVCRLLREETGVLETEWLQVECELFVIYGPLLWQTEEFPFSAALVASVIVTVEFIP